MTESERELFRAMAITFVQIAPYSPRGYRQRLFDDAFPPLEKAAVRSSLNMPRAPSAEPKPSVASDDPWFTFCRVYEKSASMMTALEAVCALKDDEIEKLKHDGHALYSAYLRLREKIGHAAFNTPYAPTPEQVWETTEAALDAQMAEIERLKVELEHARRRMAREVELHNEQKLRYAKLECDLDILEHPDIDAAAKRAQMVAALQDECARIIARAVLTREPG